MRHGAHQLAQKSTTARPLCCSICVSKSESFTSTAFDIFALQTAGLASGLRQFSLLRGRCPSSINLMTSTTPRGTRVSHVGIAVETLSASLPFFRDVLGLPEVDLDDADGATIVGFSAGESLVELLEADDANSPIGRYVAKRGPGIHH